MSGRYLPVLFILFPGDILFLCVLIFFLRTEHREQGPKAKTEQKARERVIEAKRTGEKADTTNNKKKMKLIYFALTPDNHPYAQPPLHSEHPISNHTPMHMHVAYLFFIALIKVGHTVFIPLVYDTTNRLPYAREASTTPDSSRLQTFWHLGDCLRGESSCCKSRHSCCSQTSCI